MNLNFYAYSVPFVRPFKTASETFSQRKGIILQLKKENITALGEIAPLTGFSSENMAEVERQLEEFTKPITDFFESEFTLDGAKKFIRTQSFLPSVEFGLYTLAATFLAQQKMCALHTLFSDKSSSKIPINAVIGLHSDDFKTRFDEYVASGFTAVKIKTDRNWNQQYPKIEQIRMHYPDIQIRIDANQGWSLNEARKHLQDMKKLNVEYCEEPLAHPTADSISSLKEETAVPIALDESLADFFSLEKAFEIAPVLIIKPAIVGLSTMMKALHKKAETMNVKLVFTTSLESGIGRLMTASLAACFGAPGTAHGLDTGKLLKTDLWSDDYMIRNGYYHLPDAETLSNLMGQDFEKPSYKPILTNG